MRNLAEESPYFRKKYSLRQARIREKLERAGIKTEKIILKNGRAVFEKTGHSLATEKGKALFRKKFWDNVDKLEELVAKMHSLGISHNHLHLGNITIDEHGTLRIIDLGKATMVDLNKLKRRQKIGYLRSSFMI